MGFKIKKWKGSMLGAVASAVTMNPLPLMAGAYYDMSKQQTDKQNKANQAAIDRANAYDMYTWDLANQYNDPKQQMARLQSAGLNPNLVYGSGNVTGNTTGTAGSNGVASQEAFSAMGAIQKGLPMAQALANLRNTNTQNELLKYQQGQTEAQTKFAQAKTKDLNNFLTGNGPSTYDRYRGQSTLEPSADPSIEDEIVELAPKGARPLTRRAINKIKGPFERFGEFVADIINPPMTPAQTRKLALRLREIKNKK